MSSIAATLLSTSPFASPTSRTGFSLRSVATPDVRLGHAIQSPPSGSSPRFIAGNRRASSALRVAKNTTTSRRPRACFRSTTPGGSSSDEQKPLGAAMTAKRDPSAIPSFFTSGVPEYPATAVTVAATGGVRQPGVVSRRSG